MTQNLVADQKRYQPLMVGRGRHVLVGHVRALLYAHAHGREGGDGAPLAHGHGHAALHAKECGERVGACDHLHARASRSCRICREHGGLH